MWTAVALFLFAGQPVAVYQAPGFPTQQACRDALALDMQRLEAVAAQEGEDVFGIPLTVRAACVRERGQPA